MVYIQSAMAEVRRGKTEEETTEWDIMYVSAMQGGHN